MIHTSDVLGWDHRNINVTGVVDVHYWTRVLDVSADELHKAVQEVGTHADAVRQFLATRQLSLDLQ